MARDMKTGTWINVNNKRVFLTVVGENEIEGLAYENERLRHIQLDYPQIRSVRNSKAPSKFAFNARSETIAFGYFTWDEAKRKVENVAYLDNGKLLNLNK